MLSLSPADTSILARVVQYDAIPPNERAHLLEQVSPDARNVGKVILGTATPAESTPEIIAAANAYKTWAENNRRLSRMRPRLIVWRSSP